MNRLTELNGFGWFAILICALLLYGLFGWWWVADRGGRSAPALLIGFLLGVLAYVLVAWGSGPLPKWLTEP